MNCWTPLSIPAQPSYLDTSPGGEHKDGESDYGFLISENKQTLIIQDIAGQKHVMAVKKIASKQKQNKSLMPDPVNNGLTEQNLADVVGYLLNSN